MGTCGLWRDGDMIVLSGSVLELHVRGHLEEVPGDVLTFCLREHARSFTSDFLPHVHASKKNH